MDNQAKSHYKVINGKRVEINGGPTAAAFLGDEADGRLMTKIRASAFKGTFSHKISDENSQAKPQVKNNENEDKDFKPDVKYAWGGGQGT